MIFFGGDFIFPEINWNIVESANPYENSIFEKLEEPILTQMIHFNKTIFIILDLLLTNNPNIIYSIDIDLHMRNRHKLSNHYHVKFEILTQKSESLRHMNTFYILYKCRFVKLEAFIVKEPFEPYS